MQSLQVAHRPSGLSISSRHLMVTRECIWITETIAFYIQSDLPKVQAGHAETHSLSLRGTMIKSFLECRMHQRLNVKDSFACATCHTITKRTRYHSFYYRTRNSVRSKARQICRHKRQQGKSNQNQGIPKMVLLLTRIGLDVSAREESQIAD